MDSHLRTAKVDVDSRTEAFWFKSGFPPDRKVVFKRLQKQEKIRKKKFFLKNNADFTDEEVYKGGDVPIQILTKGSFKIRNRGMIRPFASKEEQVCRMAMEIPIYEYNRKSAGFPSREQNGVNNPGYWTSSRGGRHTSLQLVSALDLSERLAGISSTAQAEQGYREDLLLGKGLIHSFGLCLAEACHLGYGPFLDPESPLALQTVVTDGRSAKLFAFQLNKTVLHMEETPEDEPNNVLWHSPEFDIFVTDEETGLETVNKKGLKDLIKFYLEEPSVEFKTDVATWEDISSNYNREYFFHDFRSMQARAPRGVKPELEAWERIYRVQFPQVWFPYGTRDRRWFQMSKFDYKGREHWHPAFRHYDYYVTQRIPKCEREDKKVFRKRKITVPVPDQDQTNIFWRRPTHPWGPSDDDWRNE